MSLTASEYDVVVVGGGPAGACTAALTAAAGHRTLVLERTRFPRFKVGESLMPATFPTLERLGVLDKLKLSRFPRKHSVQFFGGDGRAFAPFYFSENDPHESAVTWQVLRSEFDQTMLDNARAKGAEVVTEADVKSVQFDGETATGVRVSLGGQEAVDVAARVVVDASGQSALVTRKLDLKEIDPRLKKASMFTHFEGAQRDEGRDEGATLILHTRDHDSWFWYIPLPDDRVSVGVVGSIDYLLEPRSATAQEIFARELEKCPALRPRLETARQVFPLRVMRDFSYRSRQAAGDGWVLVGDAYGFLDPIYSSGVLLALRSGEFAADAIHDGFVHDDLTGERLGGFAPRLDAGMDALKALVHAFYEKDFSFARFLKRYPEHRTDIIELLIGDVFDRDRGPLFERMAEMCATAELER